MNFHGVFTALVTPFDSLGRLDLTAFKKILDDQANAHVTGVVVCGTTGETPTLEEKEKQDLITTAIKHLKGSGLLVLAGTGSNSTTKTIQASQWAESAGVDGLLIVTPYYNKPTQAGLLAHYVAVANALKQTPIMLYNVPGRTGVSFTSETVAKLSSHPRIRAIKEASGRVPMITEIQDEIKKQKTPALDIFSGDDVNFLPSLPLGACGIVSVASNLFPRAMVDLYTKFKQNDLQGAVEIHEKYLPLFKDLFIESNPGPVKAALARLGICREDMRLPLVTLSESNRKILFQSMDQCGLTASGVTAWEK